MTFWENRFKKLGLILLWIIFPTILFSQNYSIEEAHQGYCVKNDGDTIKNIFRYDFEANTLAYDDNGKLIILSSSKVSYFELYDAMMNRIRKFYTIPYESSSGYKIPIFFELLEESDRISLLSREYISYTTVNTGISWNSSYTKKILVYDFFFFDKNSKITHFDGTKKKLLELLSDRQNEIKNYIKKSHFSYNHPDGLIQILKYYNSL